VETDVEMVQVQQPCRRPITVVTTPRTNVSGRIQNQACEGRRCVRDGSVQKCAVVDARLCRAGWLCA
jgi:hypothetical protein